MDSTGICKTFHSNAEEYTLFSEKHGTVSITGHNITQGSLNKYKKMISYLLTMIE